MNLSRPKMKHTARDKVGMHIECNSLPAPRAVRRSAAEHKLGRQFLQGSRYYFCARSERAIQNPSAQLIVILSQVGFVEIARLFEFVRAF